MVTRVVADGKKKVLIPAKIKSAKSLPQIFTDRYGALHQICRGFRR